MKRFLFATVIALSVTAPAIAQEWVEFREDYEINLSSVQTLGDGSMGIEVRQTSRNRIVYRDLTFVCRVGVIGETYRRVEDRRGEIKSESLCEDVSRCAINPSPTDRALEREICFE